jgi:hypothetical protein
MVGVKFHFDAVWPASLGFCVAFLAALLHGLAMDTVSA